MKLGSTEFAALFRSGQMPKAPTNYREYRLSGREKAAYLAIGLGGAFGIGMLFFQQPILALLLSPAGLLYPRYRAGNLNKQRRDELSRQFRDALYALSVALSAGRSVESAFQCALRDLRILYSNPDTMILRELDLICCRLEMNDPLDHALQDFSFRAGMEDIGNFADVISICKQAGGNLVEVSRRSAEIIREKIELEQEIEILLARPRLEQRMLMGMPVVFLCLLNAGGEGYTSSLFATWQGYGVMLFALGLLAAAAWLSQRIMEIKV
ncbi:MAG: type II secretion system F family protein [Solirubrobacterales bacterium]